MSDKDELKKSIPGANPDEWLKNAPEWVRDGFHNNSLVNRTLNIGFANRLPSEMLTWSLAEALYEGYTELLDDVLEKEKRRPGPIFIPCHNMPPQWERRRTVDDGYCPEMEETIENLNRVGLVTQEGRVSIGDVQLENVKITPHEPKSGEFPSFTMEGTVVPISSPLPFSMAPRDGRKLLAWDGESWVMAFYDKGWYGDHHSSIHGTSMEDRNLTHFLPQPASPVVPPAEQPET